MPAVDQLQPPKPATSPAPSPHTTSAKRKRSCSPAINGVRKSAFDRSKNLPGEVPDSIRDIWSILKNHDPSPSILDRISLSPSSKTDDDQPTAKRTKLSSDATHDTIDAKVVNNSYATIENFAAEVEHAISSLGEPQTQDKPNDNDVEMETPLAAFTQERLLAQSLSLTNLLGILCAREIRRLQSATQPRKAKSQPLEQIVNDVKKEEEDDTTELGQNGRTVLTLFGNVAGHKQLFSSLQQPLSGPASSDDKLRASTKALAEFREDGLPVGISSSKVIRTEPPHGAKRPSTFADLFAPPSSLPQVLPPKTSKVVTNRDSPITFAQSTPAESTSSRTSYANEKIGTGHWLGYSGTLPVDEPSSPSAKRRQRDRALSMNGGDTSSSSTAVVAAQKQQAKEDALFRAVYSSFAPSHDNMGAVVPEESKNDLWWQRYGVYAFDQVFSPYPPLSGDDEAVEDHGEHIPEDEEAEFADAVANFEPATLESAMPGSKEELEAEEILKEISEMIQTLYSFQRIRMSSNSPGFRNDTAYRSTLGDNSSGSVASTDEIETYKALKAQLALIIGTLPPYVVSKLNGEQLEDLQISRFMPMELPDYRGVMEEDQASKTAKHQAFQAAVGAAQHHTRTNTTSTPHQAPPRSAHLPSTNRPPTTITNKAGSTFTRQPLSSWQTPSQPQNMTVQRPSYANPQSFNQPRPGMQTPNVRGYPSTQPRPPYPSQPNGIYSTPGSSSQANYQQRPPSGYNATPNASTPYTGATSSPQKQNYASGPAMQYPQRANQPQQQPSYQAQNQVPNHQQRPYIPPQGTAPSASPQPHASPSVGPTPVMTNGDSRPQTPGTPIIAHTPGPGQSPVKVQASGQEQNQVQGQSLAQTMQGHLANGQAPSGTPTGTPTPGPTQP